MKKIGLIVALVLVALLVWRGFSMYNNLVYHDEDVKQEWGEVESQYQRRLDLIPNLVEVVRGYAQVEKDILVQVTEARAKGMSGMSTASAQAKDGQVDVAAFQTSQRGVGRAMGGMFGYSEKYPELKSNIGFQKLQDQLEGTENRINKVRDDFNEVATVYNKYRRKFPANIYAGMFGFDEWDLFSSDPEAADAPDIDMGLE